MGEAELIEKLVYALLTLSFLLLDLSLFEASELVYEVLRRLHLLPRLIPFYGGADEVYSLEDGVVYLGSERQLTAPELSEDVLRGVGHLHYGLESQKARSSLQGVHGPEGGVQKLLVLGVLLKL